MTNATDVFTIAIRRRPWWFWALAGVWLLLEVVIFQTAFASARQPDAGLRLLLWQVAASSAGCAGDKPAGQTNGASNSKARLHWLKVTIKSISRMT
jgi:hypothetical protein